MSETTHPVRAHKMARDLAASRIKAGNATGRLVGMVHELRQARAEIERLKSLLAEHGIETADV